MFNVRPLWGLIMDRTGDPLRIAILGSRGIPNEYGGFEQFAEHLSVGLSKIGYDVFVYNPSFHQFKESTFKGVTIIQKWCPEKKIGSAAHIIYDYLCLKDAIRRGVDVVLELGYQSSAISLLISPINKTRIITNMDGMEWKRQKWGPIVQRFTRWAEKIGTYKSHALVSDNLGIQEYLKQTYGKESTMIPYGAEVFDAPDKSFLEQYELSENGYYILIARMEPENNIEMILDGYVMSMVEEPFVVVGNYSNEFGKKIYQKYNKSNIRFYGGIYDICSLNNLRYYARAYFHGHSVGGTNPSLLEAMASQSLIVAHDNVFNRSVLFDNAIYFQSSRQVAEILTDQKELFVRSRLCVDGNLRNIREVYRWDLIVHQYSELIERVFYEDTNHNSG